MTLLHSYPPELLLPEIFIHAKLFLFDSSAHLPFHPPSSTKKRIKQKNGKVGVEDNWQEQLIALLNYPFSPLAPVTWHPIENPSAPHCVRRRFQYHLYLQCRLSLYTSLPSVCGTLGFGRFHLPYVVVVVSALLVDTTPYVCFVNMVHIN
ncbi:hypothetical protein FB446DRAFT_795672 [Lentinula raphanica]|nr:hypothetical protein FB446DRAFT_795672 [Lentinula raphanica]